MEFLSQYDATICYIPGERNNMADALSHLPDQTIPTVASTISNHSSHSHFHLEDSFLDKIKEGYNSDPFTNKLRTASKGMDNICSKNGYWFINNQLFIPNVPHIQEGLFRLAHDSMGHFGSTKSYTSLKDSYYWPNMQCDLKNGYIPACLGCQRNKSATT